MIWVFKIQEGKSALGFVDPLPAVIVSLCFLIVLLYKRVNLGITLNATAIILALLSLSWQEIPTVVYNTTVDLLTISVVFATFGIMLLSQLYKETGFINRMSESLSRITKNPKIVLSVLPAVIGFLPVAGGALMSAPLVDSEAEKLKLKPEKKAYVNLWFRHTIFPVYPLSQVLIVAALLAGTTVPTMILRQIPVVMVMVVVGFIIGFWKVSNPENEETPEKKNELNSDLKDFFVAFSPILASIVVAVSMDLVSFNLSKLGFDVLVAAMVGVIVLVVISKLNRQLFLKPFKSWGIYGITFAAYGAFLLGNVIKATGLSKIFETLVASGNADTTILLVAIPAALGVLTASALGGVSISIPLLGGIMVLSPRMASLIYMSAYLGYVVSPTHLCFTFTADYFRCPLGKVYKYVIPSVLITFSTVLLMYFLV
jgi:integral membrane protein (TIGR00529 family)